MRHDEAAEGAKKRPAGGRRHVDHGSNNESEPVTRNVQAIVDLERKVIDERKHLSRLSDAASRIAGSAPFIVFHILLFAAWIIFNATRVNFDPYPFDLLNLALTFEAIILTS